MIWNMRRRKKKVSLTWYFNETLTASETLIFSVRFSSNFQEFREIKIYASNSVVSQLNYNAFRKTAVWSKAIGWNNEKFRTVTFDEEPTGDLLTFLQANATPL